VADKGYDGLDRDLVATPFKGKGKPEWQKEYNRLQARLRGPVSGCSHSSRAGACRPGPLRPTLDHTARQSRRFAPHQLRHAHAVEMAREGVPLIVIQRQLGHSNLGITSVYLQGIDSGEIIETVHARRAPMIPVSASVRL
jgi:integrase